MGTARSARAGGALLGVLLLLVCSAAVPLVAGEPSRCSACRAVAEELLARLDAEQPRNHIDMQHRVGPDGKRWGKVIEYKMSELRVIHLLEGLCDGMDSYEIASDAAGEHWARPGSLEGVASVSPRKEQRRQLANFCHDVIEKHEDELSQALRAGDVSSDNASDFLCLQTANLCEQTRAEEQAAAAAAQAAANEAARAAAEVASEEAEKEAASAAAGGEEGRKAEGGQGSGAGAQQPGMLPEAAGAASAAAGADAMQEARSEL